VYGWGAGVRGEAGGHLELELPDEAVDAVGCEDLGVRLLVQEYVVQDQLLISLLQLQMNSTHCTNELIYEHLRYMKQFCW
jgi:hypothetical protein